MRDWWRRTAARELARMRAEGRTAAFWSLRITVASVASYVVGTLAFPGTQPLLAPLTAMLVVQVTPVSLLASGLDRVVQVTMLITDPADYDACNAEYVRHFPGGLPARHTARFGVPTEAKVGFACTALA